jgi:hypothetical protein
MRGQQQRCAASDFGGGAVWSGLALDQANDGTTCAPKTLVFR